MVIWSLYACLRKNIDFDMFTTRKQLSVVTSMCLVFCLADSSIVEILRSCESWQGAILVAETSFELSPYQSQPCQPKHLHTLRNLRVKKLIQVNIPRNSIIDMLFSDFVAIKPQSKAITRETQLETPDDALYDCVVPSSTCCREAKAPSKLPMTLYQSSTAKQVDTPPRSAVPVPSSWILGTVTSVGPEFVILNDDVFVPSSIIAELSMSVERGTRLRAKVHANPCGRNNWRASHVELPSYSELLLHTGMPQSYNITSAFNFIGVVTALLIDGGLIVNQTLHVLPQSIQMTVPMTVTPGVYCRIQGTNTLQGPIVTAAQLMPLSYPPRPVMATPVIAFAQARQSVTFAH